jgi:serine/threonine-protein kinase ATR
VIDILVGRLGRKNNEEKIKAISSLEEVLKLIGPSIYNMTPQIMATLQTALGLPSLRDFALKTFEVFIKTIEISQVGIILNQIVAILIKDIDEYAPSQVEKVVEILEFLIIRNSSQLSHTFGYLSPLPDIASLMAINKHLRSFSKSQDIKTHISRIISIVSHENLVVAERGLLELKDFLRLNQSCT